MKKILGKLKWLALHIEEIVATVALTVMLCVIFLNVTMRYMFRSPTAWADELSMICFAYVVFLGSAAAHKKNLHFGVDILLDMLPLKYKTLIRQILGFAYIVLFAYITYLGCDLVIGSSRKFLYTGWSYKIFDAAFPLGFASMTIYSIYFFVLSFKDKKAFQAHFEHNYDEEAVDEELVKASAEIFDRDRKEGSAHV